jgi:hypothetical protein
VALEASGARVHVRVADAGDAAAMGALHDEIVRSFPPLRGVVHAAGTLDDGPLIEQDPERFAGVLRGKAHGARILDALTRDRALDFFVLYSAAGTFLGSPGQGSYAAANAELDALAHARRAAGRPALSVSWGLWSGSGMATRLSAAGRERWRSRGLRWMVPKAGFLLLERLLREGAVHAVVAPIDWERFVATLPGGVDARFFASLAPAARRARDPLAQVDTSGAGSLALRWRDLPESDRRSAVIEDVREQARRLMGTPSTVRIDAAIPLKEAGLDSLMAVELRNALARSIGRALPATLLFDYPTLDAIAGYLVGTLELGSDDANRTRVRAATGLAAALRDEFAGMSDAEAEARLVAELDAAERRLHG